VQVNKGGAETIFKSFREAIENKYTGAGLFGRISKQLDMRALRKAESFMRDRQVGAFIAPKSYIRNAARAQGISPRKLETGVRSHEGFHLGTVELGLRNQIEDMADIVPLEFAREMQKIPAYQANPMAVTEEYLAYSQTAKHTGRTPFGVDYTPANERIQELIQQHPRLKEFVNPIMSGKDDAHNIIEGMNHRGIAHRLRRLFTPFGSGWDALRGLAKGAETFQDMISSSGFQKALSSAVELKQLGKEFQFVRKQGILGESEAATMKTLQDKFAPTVYSSSEKHIDMELFEGRTASQLLKEGKLTPTNVRDIEKSVEEMHQAGLSHGDYHAGNIMVTPEGRIGAIDFGASGPIGSSGLTKLVDDQGNVVEGFYGGYTRAARKQYGKWTPEPIQIRDPEYDWGRIGQMKERMAKLQAAQPQATATSIMTGSASINTASSGMGTATGTINENTMLAVTKKVRHANLQRSAVASTWVAGKNGGKRSRL
jgi:serine/threonine protein kinase